MKITIVASLFIAAVSAATVPSELVGRQACFPNEVACRYGDDCCTGFCVPRGQQTFCGASSAGTCTNDGDRCLASNKCCGGYCGYPNGDPSNGLRCTTRPA